MAYRVEWYKEAHIFYVTYRGNLTDEDIVAANTSLLPHLEASPHPIHALVNVVGLGHLAVNFMQSLKSEILAQVSAHPRLGWVLYFNKANPIYVFMASVNAQRHDERVRFFDSEAEVLAFLQDLGALAPDDRPSERTLLAESQVIGM